MPITLTEVPFLIVYGLLHVQTRLSRWRYTVAPLACWMATHPSGRSYGRMGHGATHTNNEIFTSIHSLC